MRRLSSPRYLEERLHYLEEVHCFTIDALEMAASLGDFQTTINQMEKPSAILQETSRRLSRLILFSAKAFFLVRETDSCFVLTECDPETHRPFLQKEVDVLIENGTFAWALKERRAVIVSTETFGQKILLHAMATTSRVRGMFVGLLRPGADHISDVKRCLLSTVLLNSANALESFELYRMVREIRATLERKENYRHLFEAAPDGVEVLDARGMVLDCNKTHQALVGRAHQEIVGRHTEIFFEEGYRNTHAEIRIELKEAGFSEREIALKRADGADVYVWRKEKAIHGEKGEFIGSIAYNRDISDLKRSEAENRALQMQLQRSEKMKAIGMLAGGVAHDLNNVLAGLVSYPDLILLQLPADSDLRKPIEVMHRSGQKAAAIVQDLLTLARRSVPVNEVVNLNLIVDEYLSSPEFYRLTEFHHQVRIEKTLNPDLLNIYGSSVHLSKTVMNLISNAAEAMPDGGTIDVTTGNRYVDLPIRGYDSVERGDYVVLKISDQGVGIAREDMERVFEPFYTKKMMGRSGTGLGMAVVWGTVKDHNGYVDIESRKNVGTTFTLYFPATRDGLERKEEYNRLDALRGNGESILVVDDAEDQREIALSMLTLLGYEVTCAAGGEDALRLAENRVFDLAVLDMIMDPGPDGLETYQQLLKIHPGQRAIVASGFSETERVAEALRSGAGEYIKKPYLMEKIGMAVKKELAKKSAPRRNRHNE